MGAACGKQEKEAIEKHSRDRPPDSRALIAVYPPVQCSNVSLNLVGLQQSLHHWSIRILEDDFSSKKAKDKLTLGGQRLEPFASYPLQGERRFPDVPAFAMNVRPETLFRSPPHVHPLKLVRFWLTCLAFHS
jgi:hypothetical protein